MKNLKAYQEKFLKSVMYPHLNNLNISGTNKLNTEKALEVYQNDYILRLTDFLGDRFESCWKVLGDEDFLKSAEEYIRQTPSQYKSLGQYGQSFSTLLAQKYKMDFPFIEELASLEWSYHEYFNSPPEKTPRDLTIQERLTSKFVPKVQTRWYLSDYDLVKVFKNKSNDVELTWDDIESPCLILKYKENYKVYFEAFPIELNFFLEMIAQNIKLEEVIRQCHSLKVDEKQWATFYLHFFRAFKPVD